MRKAANSGHWADLEYKKPMVKPSPTGVDKEDPMSSVMGMMKDMYENGDDEMKRTIAKSWTESRAAQNN